jgi:hypothetical protein
VVLVFLRDWRSSAIVVITIPFALLAAVVALWGAGQTINIIAFAIWAPSCSTPMPPATLSCANRMSLPR